MKKSKRCTEAVSFESLSTHTCNFKENMLLYKDEFLRSSAFIYPVQSHSVKNLMEVFIYTLVYYSRY